MRILSFLLLALAQSGEITPRYEVDRRGGDKISTDLSLTIKIEGTDTAVNFARTLHPFLSLERLIVRADGTRRINSKERIKIDHEEARVEARYDDEDYETDYRKGDPPPPDLDKNKVRQLMWFLAAGGRSFTLSAEGAYRSDDPNQDHTGEALDLIGLAIVRMPDGAVNAGETYEKQWKGSRSEKGKKGVFAFTQKVTVENLEKKGGKTIATLVAELSGKLEGGDKDPTAEEAWTKVEGTSKIDLEVESGRVLASEGSGKVVAYFRNAAEDGGKNELTVTLEVQGKTAPR